MSRHFLFVFFLLLSISQAKERIAVGGISSSVISRDETVSIADTIRAELKKTGRFSVVERRETEALLQEHADELNEMVNERAYVLKAGELLSVDYLIYGRLVRYENVYILNLRMMNVRNGQLEKEITNKYRGSVEDMLLEAIPQIMQGMAGMEQKPRKHRKVLIVAGIACVVAFPVLWYLRKGDEEKSGPRGTYDLEVRW
jgi:TolB-like protein